ncbi:hypothetical protein QJS10_CPA16g00427 [Acorus calamus]|uniref:Nbr1-like C-terminal UBA domain-containing protein n=1 Tax=Acorus calamus TaxID=4465 RepID=A0AAV9CZN8_ACOCL|nr:hypothetical protein QJS10_CPA16g00427 [Acorus calamus]
MTIANHEPSGFHIDGIDPMEETLLKELDEMGFKEINLNKEILRLNEYNLEQSLDDLCGIIDVWCMLEVQGFADRERNKKVLLKKWGKHQASCNGSHRWRKS